MNDLSSAPAELDVVGIGNALVDVISHETDEFVDRLGVPKGAMTLIDQERATELYDAMGAAIEISGGSAANTIVGVAALGGSARYLGKVRNNDQLGAVFATRPACHGRALRRRRCDDRAVDRLLPDRGHPRRATHDEHLSGCLGAPGPRRRRRRRDPLGQGALPRGLPLRPARAQEAFRIAARHANEAGRTVALTLSDGFCVDRHRDAFLDMVEHHVDLLFANEAEILSLYQTDSFDEAAARVRHHGAVAALTRSEKGSVIVTETT